MSEADDYNYNILRRMVFYQAAETRPIHLMIDGKKTVVGWILRHKVVL